VTGFDINVFESTRIPCAYCGNAMHSAAHHPILEALNEHTLMLARLCEVLAPVRYRDAQEMFEDGTGRATIDFPIGVPGGVNNVALIERYVPFTNSTGTPVLGVYVLDAVPPKTTFNSRDLVDFTNLTVASGDQVNPVMVKGTEHLLFQWTGLSAGARCSCRIQYRRAWQAP
jgi:hypothetical protein